jgi:hypothetical protein
MIATLAGIESALLLAMARCRKRAAVLRSLAAKRPDSAGIRALTRNLSLRTRSTAMDRMLATKAAALIRSFVHTGAFDQLVLSTVARIRSQCLRNRGIR